MKQKTKFKETEIGKIPEDWEVKEIGDVAEVVGGGTPSTKNPNYWDGDTAWLTPKDLSTYNERYIKRGKRNISEEGLNNSSAKLLPKGAVLLTTRAPVGYLAIAEDEITTNQGFRSLIPNEKTFSEFLYYLLKKNVGILKLNATGTTFGELAGSRLKSLKFAFPPLPEQHQIAKILLDLDSKIELNQQMNRILEAIGQAIFKRWFVDFEFPNEKGKPYKSSGGEMIDSELGEIPKGWGVEKLGDKLTTVLGGTPSTQNENYWKDGNIPWMNSGEINKFRITEPTALITEEAVNSSATKLMPKGTTVLAITGATLGQVSRIEIDTCANQSVIGIIENEKIPSEYIYLWTKLRISDLISQKTGGAQQHINKNNVNELRILLPNKALMFKFKEIMRTIFNNISVNCFETRNLSQIRDSLLPKLMSGKIRVPIEAKT